MKRFWQVRLIMVAWIDNIIYPNKNNEVFPLGLIWVVYEMIQGHWYAWSPYIIIQI